MAALWSVGIRGFFKVALAVIDGQLFIVTDGLWNPPRRWTETTPAPGGVPTHRAQTFKP